MPKYIELTQSQIATVNNYDYRWCSLRKWHYRNGKAYTTISGKEVSLGRYVLRVFDPEIRVEYADGDGLNCRKSNLTIKTKQK